MGEFWFVPEECLVFTWGHGGKLVEGELEGALGVVLLDEAGIGEEDAKASLVFVAHVELVCVPHP